MSKFKQRIVCAAIKIKQAQDFPYVILGIRHFDKAPSLSLSEKNFTTLLEEINKIIN